MAEFDYFCTEGEFLAVLTEAMANGYRVHVKKHLEEPRSEFHRDPSEISAELQQGNRAFLLERADITRYPVGLVSVEGSGTRAWAARPKEGGPVIEAYFWAPHDKDGRRVVACSLFSYHSKIIRPDTGELEPAGEALKKAFTALVEPLRRRSRMVTSRARSAAVSPDVDAMLAAGCVLAPPFGGG